jgi:DNA-binding NtrC family response regulator
MKVKSFRRAMQEFEREYLTVLLKQLDGNVSQAARTAGLSRRTVQLKLAALKLNADKFRPREKRWRA